MVDGHAVLAAAATHNPGLQTVPLVRMDRAHTRGNPGENMTVRKTVHVLRVQELAQQEAKDHGLGGGGAGEVQMLMGITGMSQPDEYQDHHMCCHPDRVEGGPDFVPGSPHVLSS